MPLVINTNVASLSAQNSMNRAQMDQNEAMERLTTGKRINTAADDAAGLSIANKMTSQVKGLNQAVRNANDGISMLQTAAGGLEETSNILQRMRELSVQSASGTYTETNRDAMQAEVTQLKAELDRISETTTFNGQNILDGSQKNTSLQVGANANETIDFSIDSTAAKRLGSGASGDVTGTANTIDAGAFAGDFTINGQTVNNTSFRAEFTSTNGVQAGLTYLETNVTGVDFELNVATTADSVGDGRLAAGQVVTFTVKELDASDTTFSVKGTGNMEELVDEINRVGNGRIEASLTDDGRLALFAADAETITVVDAANATGGLAAAGGAHQGSLTMTDESGDGEVSIAYNTAADADILGINASVGGNNNVTASAAVTVGTGFQSGDLSLNGIELGEYDIAVDYDGNGTVNQQTDVVGFINSYSGETGVVASLSAASELELTSVDGSPISIDYAAGETTAMEGILHIKEQNSVEAGGGSVASIDISTAAGAQRAITTLDQAIEQVSDIQSSLGAVNNRLDFTVNNLSNVSENASAARSRIEDADFAAESANLSRAKVLQQAGQTMLAQANSAPQQVLSLLQ